MFEFKAFLWHVVLCDRLEWGVVLPTSADVLLSLNWMVLTFPWYCHKTWFLLIVVLIVVLIVSFKDISPPFVMELIWSQAFWQSGILVLFWLWLVGLLFVFLVLAINSPCFEPHVIDSEGQSMDSDCASAIVMSMLVWVVFSAWMSFWWSFVGWLMQY